MPSVTFLPAGVSESYRDGETLFEIGRRAGVDIETACVGQGTCGLCRVRVIVGEEFLNPYTDEEQKHLGNVYYLTKVRLSCRSVAAGGDISVELAPKKRRSKRGPPRSQTRPPADRLPTRSPGRSASASTRPEGEAPGPGEERRRRRRQRHRGNDPTIREGERSEAEAPPRPGNPIDPE